MKAQVAIVETRQSLNGIQRAQCKQMEARIDKSAIESIQARWEFGKWLVELRNGGDRLPNGIIKEIVQLTGKSERELQYRTQFYEAYPTKERLRNALRSYPSWHEQVVGLADMARERKRERIRGNLEDVANKTAKEAEGKYDVLVIDPPWPIKKIEREVRPNQMESDYPLMNLEEIEAELHERFRQNAADDCHIFLWTTQKYLFNAGKMLEHVGLNYICTFVWHKPGGMQPIGLPQYNCEFIIYVRKGTPEFVDTKAFFTAFSAPRTKHSEKPEEFYEILRRVTVGRRLDVFSRRQIEGFDGWGKEAI